jgi:hypothetical protein
MVPAHRDRRAALADDLDRLAALVAAPSPPGQGASPLSDPV